MRASVLAPDVNTVVSLIEGVVDEATAFLRALEAIFCCPMKIIFFSVSVGVSIFFV